MLPQAVLVFALDFLTEIAAVFWVLSVNRSNLSRAVVFTILNAALTRLTLYLVIEEPSLLWVSFLGEVLGTFVAMCLDGRRNEVGKMQKRAGHWLIHSLLRRPVPKRRRARKS